MWLLAQLLMTIDDMCQVLVLRLLLGKLWHCWIASRNQLELILRLHWKMLHDNYQLARQVQLEQLEQLVQLGLLGQLEQLGQQLRSQC
jgi:hypothetical protein